jgi:tetratricopeptide (TPR) repeat protein
MLHLALRMAQQSSNIKAESYIFAILAENAFEKGDYVKSEILYKQTLERALIKGTPEGDEAIVEISMRLAAIFGHRQDYQKADEGFAFCFKHQTPRARELDMNSEELGKKDKNSLALYAMLCDYYAKYLMNRQAFETALKYTKEALKYCLAISGPSHHQTLTLLSDLGTVYTLLNRWDEAMVCFQRAVTDGKESDSEYLPILYYNLGMCQLKTGNPRRALNCCGTASRMAGSREDVELQAMADECVRQAVEAKKKEA